MPCVQSPQSDKNIQCDLPDFEIDQESIKNLIHKKKEQKKCFRSFLSNYPPPENCVLREDDIWNSISTTYLEIKNQVDALKIQMESLKDALICMSGESNSMGAGIILSKVVRKGSIDYNEVLRHFNIDVDLEQFRGASSESWRLSELR